MTPLQKTLFLISWFLLFIVTWLVPDVYLPVPYCYACNFFGGFLLGIGGAHFWIAWNK